MVATDRSAENLMFLQNYAVLTMEWSPWAQVKEYLK
jgi:hypothetical protein